MCCALQCTALCEACYTVLCPALHHTVWCATPHTVCVVLHRTMRAVSHNTVCLVLYGTLPRTARH